MGSIGRASGEDPEMGPLLENAIHAGWDPWSQPAFFWARAGGSGRLNLGHRGAERTDRET